MKKLLDVLLWVVLYFVAFLAADCLGFIHPFLYLFFALAAAILCAWPYVKLNQKHPVTGMGVLISAFTVCIFAAMGEAKMDFVAISLGLGIVADAVRYLAGPYGSAKSICASYPILALMPFSAVLFLWTAPDHMYAPTLEEMGEAYANAMQPLFNAGLEVGMILLTLALAYGCAWFFTRKRNA